MFNSSRSFLTLVNLLALSSAFAFAAPHPHKGKHSGSGPVAHKLTNTALDAIERRDNARFTYYDAGENACGGHDSSTDYVSAAADIVSRSGVNCSPVYSTGHRHQSFGMHQNLLCTRRELTIPQLYNNGAHCYKTVTVQYNGQQVKATVTDEVCLQPCDAKTEV